MRKRDRHLVYEAAALSAAGLLGAFAVPELLNEHDSIAAMCAGMLVLGWVVWFAYFYYRAWGK